MVGRCTFVDSTGADASGFVPKLMDGIPHNEDGVGGAHLYMPWWLDNKKLDFPRGYHIEIGGGRGMPYGGFGANITRFSGMHEGREIGGYGKTLKNEYRRFYGATVGFSGRGEMVPNKDSYCELDPNTVDCWGIPVLRFHFKWSDYEYNQVKHMQETFREIITAMGGTSLRPMPSKDSGYGIATGGRIIHEVGTTRMGSDPDDIGAEQILPGARGEEPVRRRRRLVCVAGGQVGNPHVDDSRAVDESRGVHRRGKAQRKLVMGECVNG